VFQLRQEVFRKPGKEALKTILETALWIHQQSASQERTPYCSVE
jgi:hypothetical protein